MSDITGIAPRSGLERDVVALASARWPTAAPMSGDDIAELLLLIRRSRALRRRSKHTKAVRRARARAYWLRESWERAPLRLQRVAGEWATVCGICRCLQGRWGEERHHVGCSVLRLNPGLAPVNDTLPTIPDDDAGE